MFDVSRLTMGEIAKIEELSGMSITAIGDEEKPKGKALAAMAYVIKRREDPKYTWNDAMGLTFDEANALLGFGKDDAADSEEDGEDRPTPRPRRAPRKTSD